MRLFVLFIFISISIQSQNISLRNQANQYDFIIITQDEFVENCIQFAEHKNNVKGLKTLVTTKNNIIAEFSDSTLLQDNIREFISYVGTQWATPQPIYFMFAADIENIPNYSFEILPNTSYHDTAKSDYFYGINVHNADTTKLSFSIGRIAARTEDELSNYFNKVINYENENSIYGWNNNTLFLADDGKTSYDSIGNDLFENIAFQVSDVVPSFISKKYYFQSDSSEYFGTKDSIINYINMDGISSMFFSGHGNDTIYTHEALFTISDVDKLYNINKPFFASFGHSQSFSNKNNSSMLDQMLFSNNGALLGVAPVGVNYAQANEQVNSLIWKELYSDTQIGSIFIDTFNKTSSQEHWKYNLFGDPTIKLKYDIYADVNPYPMDIPMEYQLSQNYPNPFNPTTKISYSIPSSILNGLKVNLSVYNILGQEVAVLVNAFQNAGSYEVEFDASLLSSGAYLYRLSAGSFVQTNKMILMK